MMSNTDAGPSGKTSNHEALEHLLDHWTSKESIILANIVRKIGTDWSTVSKNIKNPIYKLFDKRPINFFHPSLCERKFRSLLVQYKIQPDGHDIQTRELIEDLNAIRMRELELDSKDPVKIERLCELHRRMQQLRQGKDAWLDPDFKEWFSRYQCERTEEQRLLFKKNADISILIDQVISEPAKMPVTSLVDDKSKDSFELAMKSSDLALLSPTTIEPDDKLIIEVAKSKSSLATVEEVDDEEDEEDEEEEEEDEEAVVIPNDDDDDTKTTDNDDKSGQSSAEEASVEDSTTVSKTVTDRSPPESIMKQFQEKCTVMKANQLKSTITEKDNKVAVLETIEELDDGEDEHKMEDAIEPMNDDDVDFKTVANSRSPESITIVDVGEPEPESSTDANQPPTEGSTREEEKEEEDEQEIVEVSVDQQTEGEPEVILDTVEDTEKQRQFKRSALDIWKSISDHRHAHLFQRPVPDSDRLYHRSVHYQIDLSLIKRQIRALPNLLPGVRPITSMVDFRRALLQMVVNCQMFNDQEADPIVRNGFEMYDDALELFDHYHNNPNGAASVTNLSKRSQPDDSSETSKLIRKSRRVQNEQQSPLPKPTSVVKGRNNKGKAKVDSATVWIKTEPSDLDSQIIISQNGTRSSPRFPKTIQDCPKMENVDLNNLERGSKLELKPQLKVIKEITTPQTPKKRISTNSKSADKISKKAKQSSKTTPKRGRPRKSN